MDQRTLLEIVAAIRQILDDFAKKSDDPARSLHQLSGEIDRVFSSALTRFGEDDQEIITELHAVLLDQIALLRRAHLMSEGSASQPRRI